MNAQSAARSWLRWLLLTLCTSITLLWLLSLAPLWGGQKDHFVDDFTRREGAAAPGWRDALLVRIAITDTAIQEQRGVVQWRVNERLARIPLSVVADGRPRTLVVPVGIHPDWEGDIKNLQIVFPKESELALSVTQAQIVQRSPFALDALLGRIMTPIAINPPDFQSLMLFTALLVSICLGLVAPVSGRVTRRRVMVGLTAAVCVAASGVVIVEQARLLPPLWQRYADLDESTLALYVPHYSDSAQVNELLSEAHLTLPDGDILIFDPGPATSYRKIRAFYLLYPRRVNFSAPQPMRLPPSTVGMIQPATGRPPAPGWLRVAGPLAGLEVWRAPHGNLPALPPSVGIRQFPHWLLALGIVLIAGFGVGSALGWRGLRRWSGALPLGAGAAIGWMTFLSLASLPWTLATIGIPLLCLGGALTALTWRTVRCEDAPPTSNSVCARSGVLLVMGIVSFLLTCIVVQAALLPFTDQDSWTTWGFNSRALFVEGSVLRFLDHYAASEMNHPSYPPGLPLLNAWVYLALGGVSERLVKLAMPLWWLSLVGLVWGEARRLSNMWLGVGLTLLTATTPIFLDHATLGNADLPFTVALTVAASALSRWIVAGAWRELVGAVLALGVAAWFKLDGLYLGLAFIGCAGVARWLHLCWQPREPMRRLVGQTILALLALIVIYAPWLWLTRRAGVASETPPTAMLAVTGLANLVRALHVVVSELLFSYNNSTWSLLGAGFLLLWPICLVIILTQGWRARRNAPFLFLVAAMLTTLLFYTLIYVLRPYFSIERYVMHAAPLVVLAAIQALTGNTSGADQSNQSLSPALRQR